ncbi:hypothetical protein BKA70DRAFT_1564502 [Coprinopsis sp. MPI-PUGE-AT-0042]|nr:hypothetical protein BKA70DRAFT_1564502 [Coprinopsis sp. MPI-PUGE-AT-0042]
MSPTILTVPREIIFEIIDYLQDCHSDLKTTSLVCKGWQYHSQQRLYRTFTLTVNPQGHTAHRLEVVGSSSFSRVRGYVERVCLYFNPDSIHRIRAWLHDHGELLARVFKELPLETLTDFTLGNGWIPFWAAISREGPTSPLLAVMHCITEICAAPKLTTLTIFEPAPFAELLSSCGPSLKNLCTIDLGKSQAALTNMHQSRAALVELEALVLRRDWEWQVPAAEGWIGLDNYILDPRSLIGLSSLKRLEAEIEFPVTENLSRILASCVDSLEDLSVNAREVLPRDYNLGIRRAYRLKRFNCSLCGARDQAEVTLAINWLLRELSDRHLSQTPLGGHTKSGTSSLKSVGLRLYTPLISYLTMTSTLAEVLSDKNQFPVLENVDFTFTFWLESGKFLSEPERRQIEVIEAGMASLKKREMLRVKWEGKS